MVAKKIVKIELSNPRFVRSEMRDHASEFIHYAKYAGYTLDGFNKHIVSAKLFPLKPEIAERNHRLVVETTLANARVIFQITQIYPSFKNWTIKSLTPGVEVTLPQRKTPAVAKPSSTKTGKAKKSAAKAVTKKKTKAKRTATKAVANKKIKAKKTATKTVAKKKTKAVAKKKAKAKKKS